jgi:hypothetical protein
VNLKSTRIVLAPLLISGLTVALSLFATSTAHAEPTWTPTPTSTPTATPTATPTPPAAFTWAVSPIEPETGITDALEDLLTGDPPGGTTTLWAITDAAASPDGWYISLANLTGISAPYEEWSAEENSIWLGSAECIEDVTWTCTYYEPTLPEGGGGLIFPWRNGEAAVYGYSGVHPGGWFTEYAVDFFPATNETYASEAGTVTWVCGIGTYNTGALINGISGDLLYLHLDPSAPIEVGDFYRQGDLVGSLVRGSFDDLCGKANQYPNNAHVHFGFDSSGNYFSIGGCVLDLTTEIFNCQGDLIGIQESLTNSGQTSGGSNDPPAPSVGTGGGSSIWDALVQVYLDLFKPEDISLYLPEQEPRIDYFLGKATIVTNIVFNFVNDIVLGPAGSTTYIMAQVMSVILGFEITYYLVDVLVSIMPFISKALRFIW